MAFQTGSQVNPALGRTDFTPFLQGAMQGAQAQGRAGELIGKGLAGLGEQAGAAIKEYYLKKETKELEDGAVSMINERIKKNPVLADVLGIRKDKDGNYDQKAMRVGAKTFGLKAIYDISKSLDDEEKLKGLFNQTNAPAAGVAMQGGASFEQLPTDGEAYQSTPLTAQQFLERGFSKAVDPSKLVPAAQVMASLEAARNKTPVQFGVVEVPRTDPSTNITTVSVVDSRTGQEVGSYVKQPAVSIGAPAAGTTITRNPDGSFTSSAIKGAPKTEDQIKREDAAEAQKTAKATFGGHIKSVFSNIMELNRRSAIVNSENDIFTNFRAKIGSSALGQAIGGTGGSEITSIQNQIVKIRPLMIQALAEATGIKSTQLNSNQELKFYLDAVADPNTDFYSNLAALDSLSRQVVGEDLIGELLQDNPGMLSRIRRESIGFQNKKPLKLDVSADSDPAATNNSKPNQAAIDYLQKNPNARADFDKKYGAGAAKQVLGN